MLLTFEWDNIFHTPCILFDLFSVAFRTSGTWTEMVTFNMSDDAEKVDEVSREGPVDDPLLLMVNVFNFSQHVIQGVH